MKKLFLTFACVATLLVVSCKESTQDKVEEATEAVIGSFNEGIEQNCVIFA